MHLRNKDVLMYVIGKAAVKALQHVTVPNTRTLAHVSHCPVRSGVTRKEQPTKDECSAKLLIIPQVTVSKLLALCTNQSVIGLI